MNIQPVNYNVNMRGNPKNPDFWKRIQQMLLDAVPEHTIKDGAKRYALWSKVDKLLSKPAENRLIMGVTALAAQPLIDANNRKVDKETREVAVCRTIAKILAGTAVGIVVRGLSHKLVLSMTEPKSIKKAGKALLPTKHLSDIINSEKLLNNYRSALSTSLAIGAMCFTNFLVDAPLTVFLTNYFNEKRLEAKEAKKEKNIVKKGVDYYG